MIEFKNVHKWFGSIHVLNDINLFIKPGEVVVVCGPSGSGKSTLIRCINRLEPIQKGNIVVDGMSLNDRKTNLTKLRAEVERLWGMPGGEDRQFHRAAGGPHSYGDRNHQCLCGVEGDRPTSRR